MNTIIDVVKIGDNKIQFTIQPVVENSVTTYTYEELQKQRQSIQKRKDQDNVQRDSELAEIDSMLSQADKLNVKPLPVDQIIQGQSVISN